MSSSQTRQSIAHPTTRGSAFATLTLALLAAVLLALAACGSAVQAGGRTAQGGATQPTATGSATGTPGATGTVGATGTPSPQQNGSGGTATPTAHANVPFSVSAVQIVSSPGNFNGVCTPTMAFTFSAQISVPAGTAGGTVTYLWVHDQSVETDTRTATFAPGQTSQTVSDSFSLPAFQGGGATHSDQLALLAPNDLSTPLSHFTFACVVKVTAVSVSFTPTTFDCNSLHPSQVFTFKAVLSVTPGPATTGSYEAAFGRYSGTTSYSSGTFQIPYGPTSVTVTIQHVISKFFSANGTYFETFWVTAPTYTGAYTATFTKSC